jgi:rfaE bifunctional protein kinase chain/domain
MTPRREDLPSHSRLTALIAGFRGRRVVVLGDPVLDIYVYGTTHRISREAPVLIVREDARETRLGGAANAAANLAALGADACFVGLVGDDDGAEQLAELFRARGVDDQHLLRAPARRTVTKTRIMAGGIHTTKQQMLRLDREDTAPPSDADRARIEAAARQAARAAEALVVSDYGEGHLSPLYAAVAREAAARGTIVVVDSRFRLDAYRGVTAVTPNAPEAAAMLGADVDAAADAARGAERLLETLELRAVLLTRGREGMAVAERGGPTRLVAAHGHREAVDVTGAGDTVTATLTLGLAAGGSVLESALLANCAGGCVVQKVGTATLTPDELTSAASAIDPTSVGGAS